MKELTKEKEPMESSVFNARNSLSQVLARPADDVGRHALELADGIDWPDGPFGNLAKRMLSAVVIEWVMRNADWLVDDYRRSLQKYLEDPSAAMNDFEYKVPLSLMLVPGNGGDVFPALASKMGTAKVIGRTRNTLSAQLELF